MTMLHSYPYYIGVALPNTIRASQSPVRAAGRGQSERHANAGTRRLTARFEGVESVYGLKKTPSGVGWRTNKVAYPMGDEVGC